jgi:hypothetical protein
MAMAVVMFLRLDGARWMKKGTNISKLARLLRCFTAMVVVMAMIMFLTFPHRGTQSLLVDVGMVLNLLPGMSLVAIFATRASIEQASLKLGGNIRCTKHLSSRNNIRAHFRGVAKEDWIPA